MAVGEWFVRYPGVDLSLDRDDLYLAVHPEVGMADLRVDDVDVPRGDGRMFGRDFLGGTSIVLPITLRGNSAADIDVASDVLRKVWRADSLRSVPGAVAELWSSRGRAAIGRPRRIIIDDENAKYGISRVTATFETVDSLWYGPEQSVSVAFVPAPSGGLIAPLVEPLSTTRTSDRSVGVTVAGECAAPIVLEIQGPITNPVVEIVGVAVFEFNIAVAFDETLVLDSSPWHRSITVNGAAVPGALTPQSTRLSRAVVEPGTYEVAFRGMSETASAQLTIRHRPTFASY